GGLLGSDSARRELQSCPTRRSSDLIGNGAFIGSNSALVAPVSIGDHAYVASGSVITEDVPEDALAFGRARQKTLPGKGRELRERSEEHTSELQSRENLVCRLLLEKQ